MGFASSAVRFNGRATLGERWPFRLRATAALIRITWRDRRRDKTTARDFTQQRGPQTGRIATCFRSLRGGAFDPLVSRPGLFLAVLVGMSLHGLFSGRHA